MGIEEKIREHLLAYRAKHNKTQKGMADLLGVSTVTYQEMEKGIVRSVKGLNKLKEKTGFHTQENVYDNVISRKADVGDELNRLIELSIRHEATLDVLRLSIESILADTKGRALPLVSEELQEAIKKRADRLFDEYSKKR